MKDEMKLKMNQEFENQQYEELEIKENLKGEKSKKKNQRKLEKKSKVGIGKLTTNMTKKFKDNNKTQSAIKYDYFTESNITVISEKNNLYSKTYKFLDINYTLVRSTERENIFMTYVNMLNSLNKDIRIQMSIVNEFISDKKLKKRLLIKHKNNELDTFVDNYNELTLDKLKIGRNNVQQVKYITVTVNAINIEKAKQSFIATENKISETFKRIGSSITEVNNNEKVYLLKNILNKRQAEFDNERQINFDIKEDKNIIAPSYIKTHKGYIESDNKFIRTFFIKDVGAFVMDDVITRISEVSKNQLVSINIEKVDNQKAKKFIKNKIQMLGMKKASSSKNAENNNIGSLEDLEHTQTAKDIKYARDFLDDIEKNNQKMFLANIVITLICDTKEELDIETEQIQSMVEEKSCESDILYYRQLVGLNSCLPIGNNIFEVKRTYTSESMAVFIPFNSIELSQKSGNLYGVNQLSKKIIMLNRKKLAAGHGFIFGSTGKGKSFRVKQEILNTALNNPDDEIIIIDPENEYGDLVVKLNGQSIDISPNSNTYIDIMDMTRNYNDGENPINLKSDFIISICETIIGDRYGMDGVDKAIIDRCVRMVYSEYVQDFDKNKLPTFKELYDCIVKQPEEEARRIALSLEMYVKGSLSVFSNKTNVDLKNKVVSFNILDLGETLKPVGLQIVLDFIWTRLIQNRNKGKTTWIYIDESHLLFKNEYSADYLEKLYKRARKFGGKMTAITQNIQEILLSDKAKNMISNSEFIILLGLEKIDRNIFKELLNLTDSEDKVLDNAPIGSGLIKYGNVKIPFEDRISENSEIYKLIQTDLGGFKNAS